MELIFYRLIEHFIISICDFSLEIFKTLNALFFFKTSYVYSSAGYTCGFRSVIIASLGKTKM
jgi:hypothetical protein